MDERCIHDMIHGTCGECDGPRIVPASNVFVQIVPAKLYHLEECDEVTWDPAEAECPGERVRLTRAQVIAMLADGTLERGGFCCGANATASP